MRAAAAHHTAPHCSLPFVGPTCDTDSSFCPAKNFYNGVAQECQSCSTAGPKCSEGAPGTPDRYSGCISTAW